jgi:outer membrane protein OmpA-like peptidoglycan-associated protein
MAIVAKMAPLGVLLLSGCALLRPPPPAPEPPPPEGTVLNAAELPRIRCLVVAPFENASDVPRLGEVATLAMVASIDPEQTRVFPLEDLRALMAGTPLELPDEGVSPRLALSLGAKLGADGVLHGAIEGRVHGSATDFVVTVRLQAAPGRDLFFATVAEVRLGPAESIDVAMRRALLYASRQLFLRMGTPGPKTCFDRELVARAKALRAAPLAPTLAAPAVVAPAAEVPRPAAAPDATGAVATEPPLPPPPPPPPARPRFATDSAATITVEPYVALSSPTESPPSPSPTPPRPPKVEPGPPTVGVSSVEPPAKVEVLPPAKAEPVAPKPPPARSPPRPALIGAGVPGGKLTERQAEMARKLEGRERFVLEGISFAGRSPVLVDSSGLVDLARVLSLAPDVNVRLESFVDATENESEDGQASMAMAMAATRRLGAFGIDRSRISVLARGGEAPIVPNFTAKGRASNRRLEVVPLGN